MEEIARNVYRHLLGNGTAVKFMSTKVTQFADGTSDIELAGTVRGSDVFFFHSLTDPNPDTAFMQLLITGDALARASARSIRYCLPYMSGYQRQDRKDRAHVGVTARLIWTLIEANRKVSHGITLDMHCPQQQGFAMIPVDDFPGWKILTPHFHKLCNGDVQNYCVASADLGGLKRVRRFAEELVKIAGSDIMLPVVSMEKGRHGPNATEMYRVIGDVQGKDVIVYDDIIDTAGTIISAAQAFMGQGARSVTLAATHAVFSPSKGTTAEEKLIRAGFQVVVTNSITHSVEKLKDFHNLTVLPIDETYAKIIGRTLSGESVSGMYE